MKQYMIKYTFKTQGHLGSVGEVCELVLGKHLLSIQAHFTRNKFMCLYNIVVCVCARVVFEHIEPRHLRASP